MLKCGAPCAPSTTMTAPFSWAICAISLIGFMVPRTLETIVRATIFVLGVMVLRTSSIVSVPSS